MSNKLNPLPPSSDTEFWQEAEVLHSAPVKIPICVEHEYVQKGSAASCTHCPYGTLLPGYMRVHEGKIVDLRALTSS